MSESKKYEVVSKLSLQSDGGYYQWGEHCDGWNLVDEKTLSVKLEKMPPHSAEQKHFHQHVQQFFYILKGEAVFEIQQERICVNAEQGIFIEAGKVHRILNESDKDLEFILTSQPSTVDDRINIK